MVARRHFFKAGRSVLVGFSSIISGLRSCVGVKANRIVCPKKYCGCDVFWSARHASGVATLHALVCSKYIYIYTFMNGVMVRCCFFFS